MTPLLVFSNRIFSELLHFRADVEKVWHRCTIQEALLKWPQCDFDAISHSTKSSKNTQRQTFDFAVNL